MTILINAYACSPDMGSEPGMAWNWCIHLARHCVLHIITESEFKDRINEAVAQLPQGRNMHFYFNPVPEKVRRMCWNQGDWRFYWFYRKWQQKTLEIARHICREQKIDIIHQLNMIGFREPGYLWSLENIPFVWGPINAKEGFPTTYLSNAKFKELCFIIIKNTINKLQLRFSPRIRKAASHAKVIISASSDSDYAIRKYFKTCSIVINETGCNPIEKDYLAKRVDDGFFHLLWIGRNIFTKQIKMAIDTLCTLEHYKVQVHFVGLRKNDEDIWKQYASKKHVEEKCIWHGYISHHEVQELMQKYHMLFFTSLAEGTPHVVLEAIRNQLPILCFDTCGQGDCVNDTIGIKVPLTNYGESINTFSEIISRIYNNRNILENLSKNCSHRCEELSWDSKTSKVVRLYKQIIEE